MYLLCLLQKAWPELLSQVLLSQHQLHVLSGVVDLGVLDINLVVQLELDGVVFLQGVRVAGKLYCIGLDVQLEVGGLDIGDGDGYVDEVLFGVVGGGALCPKDCGGGMLVGARRRGSQTWCLFESRRGELVKGGNSYCRVIKAYLLESQPLSWRLIDRIYRICNQRVEMWW